MQKVPAFEAILDLEFDVNSARLQVTWPMPNVSPLTLENRKREYAAIKAELSAAVEALSFEELVSFRDYRRAVRAAYAAK